MKTTNLINFDGFKFRQAKAAILGKTPDFTGENWEMLKDVAHEVAEKSTVRMWAYLHCKLFHKLACK